MIFYNYTEGWWYEATYWSIFVQVDSSCYSGTYCTVVLGLCRINYRFMTYLYINWNVLSMKDLT